MHTATAAIFLLFGHAALAEPFTYQGKLDDNGQPANGLYDLQVRLLDGPDPGTAAQIELLQLNDVPVSNGIFTTELNFTTTFDGTPYWLELGVRAGASTGGYSQLLPTQAITATPEAQVSLSAATGSIDSAAIADGSVGAADIDTTQVQARVTGNCPTGQSIRSIEATGAVTCEVDDVSQGWSFTGNDISTGQFLGTTNSEPLELQVNGLRVLRITDQTLFAAHAPNIVAGSRHNVIAATDLNGDPVAGATLSGGYGAFVNACGVNDDQICFNTVQGRVGTVAGGQGNYASGLAATVSGGASNTAYGDYSTAAGGSGNKALNRYSTVAGGFDNDAGGSSSMVAGGYKNQAGGNYSFAAGYLAKVRDADPGSTYYSGDNDGDEGTFIWADYSLNQDLISTGRNQFLVRATGGVWFGNNSTVSFPNGSFLATSTGAHLTTGGTWTNSSDENHKENFRPVDGEALLKALAILPIQRWNYKAENDTVLHIGPTAQAFRAAFGLGHDEKHIATVDADGVALAAIQALTRRLARERERTARLAAEVAMLKQQQVEMAELRQMLHTLLTRTRDLDERESR